EVLGEPEGLHVLGVPERGTLTYLLQGEGHDTEERQQRGEYREAEPGAVPRHPADDEEQGQPEDNRYPAQHREGAQVEILDPPVVLELPHEDAGGLAQRGGNPRSVVPHPQRVALAEQRFEHRPFVVGDRTAALRRHSGEFDALGEGVYTKTA